MRFFVVLAVVLALIASVSAYGSGTKRKWARCVMTPTDGNTLSGEVRFTFNDTDGLFMYVEASGITQNLNAEHSIFIHMFGDLTSSDASATGDCVNDLTGGWMVDGAGSISQVKNLDFLLVPLINADSLVGRSIVIYDANYTSCADANAQPVTARLSQCVTGIGQPTLNVANQAQNTDNPATSVCVLQDRNNGNIAGTFFFTQGSGANDRVTVLGQITGLVSGQRYGLGLYTWGDLGNEGDRYNPGFLPHAIPGVPQNIFQSGDMGNVFFYDTDGTAYYTLDYSLFDTIEPTNVPLFSTRGAGNIIGRTIGLNQNEDDCTTPTGNVGDLIASCVIGTANPQTQIISPPAALTADQDLSNCPNRMTSSAAVTSNTADPNGATSLAVSALTAVFAMLFIFY